MLTVRKNIVWLASYPKSGNTWFRIFLSNLLSDLEEPTNINDLNNSTVSSNRSLFDNYLGVNTSDLTTDEIEILRPEVYRMMSLDNESDVFLKTHDAWRLNSNKTPIFPEEVTKGVIYFIRNPLDIAVSFAFHNDIDFDRTINNINNNKFGFCLNNSKLANQIPQQLSSWSEHVSSWVFKSNYPICIIRFEDMIGRPKFTFSKALDFLKIEYTDDKLSKALKNSSFNILVEQEEKFGFQEKYIHSKKFFRSGTTNNWKYHLNTIQIKQIIKYNGTVMKEFGYLD
ncbi:MAG: sulfotransferase domain-containing protein [Bacteroidales bacterium]|nr:sulfotransferase domain-containing protein [Bacteroidales bacterium]